MCHGARKGLAFFLTWVLVFQAIYGANTTEAIAEGMQDLGEQIAVSLPAGDDDGGDSGDSAAAPVAGEQDGEPRTAPVDLTADTDALVLGSDGLSLAYDKTATDGLTAATSLDAVTLPEKIAAALSLRVDLVATRQTADAGLTGVLLAGDTFDVALPDGIALADDAAPVALYAADEQGNPTATQVAEGRVAAGKLHVTLAADQQAGTNLGASLVAVASLDVTVDSMLVSDAASTLTWTLQTPPNASVRTCDLTLPGREEVVRALNLLVDEQDGADAGDNNASEPSQPAGPTTTIAPSTDRSAAATPFVTAWADNNNVVRPSAEELEARREYRLYFQIEGDDTRYPLTTDGRSVSADAQRLLGMTQDELDAIRKAAPFEYGLEPELVDVNVTGTNEYTATAATGLPSEVVTTTVTTGVDADGKPIQDTQTSSKKITYGICHETAGPEGTKVEDNALIYDSDAGEPTYIVLKDGYFGAQSAPFERECLALVQKQQLTVVLNLGRNSSYVDNLDEWLSTPLAGGTTFANHLHIDAMKNGQKDQSYSGDDLTQLFHWAGATFSQQGGSSRTTYLLSMYAPVFTQSQQSLEFRLSMDEVENSNVDGYRDYYQVWYSSEGATGGSADASASLNGGTMTVTRAGNTSFDATKVWLDDDPSARPSTTYTLWRYSDKQGQSSLVASQVQADNGDFVSVTMTAEQNAALGAAQMGGVNGDVPQNNATVDIAERLEATAGNMTLPKYDQDGYPYIYFVRETMDGGDYQQIAGTVGRDGSVDAGSDAVPGYWNPDRSNREGAQESATTRPAGDTPIYDGGTVTNVRSKITQQKATKTWDAAAFQDQLSDVTVTLKCQRILKRHVHESEPGSGVWELNHDPMYDEDGNWIGTYEWTDFEAAPGETPTVQELSGWSAENLTQTLTGNYGAYDEHGEEYVYRWVETNVEKGGEPSFYFSSDDGMSGIFFLYFTNEDGEDESVTFVSNNDPKTGTITNRYANTTDRHVDKYWAKVDAGGDVEYDENDDIIYTQDEKPYDNRGVGPVTVRLVRDGELIGKYQLDGKPDDEPTDLMNPDGSAMMGDEVDLWDMGIVSSSSTVQETSPWHLDFSNLPEFSSEGHRYTYQVLEDDTPGFSTTHEYDQDTKTSKIYNRPQTGSDSSIIRVGKDWKDGGNNSARVPVRVGVFAKRDTYSTDGRLAYNAGQLITSVDLSTANDWYAEAIIGVSGLTKDDVYLCELSTDNTSDPTEPVPAGATRMVTKQKCAELAAEGIVEYKALLNSWTGTNDRMLTSGYAYEVSYGWSDVLEANVVLNRRVGLQQINIFKDWEDAGAMAGERPSANFTITNDEDKVTFVYNGSGAVSAHIDGMGNLPLVGEESVSRNGAEDSSDLDGAFARTPIVIGQNASVSEDGHGLSLKVSRETGTTQSYYIVQNLPKYDMDGNVLHWTVTERWTSDSGDYVSRQTGRDDFFEGEGSAWHHLDYSSFSFENTRSATKTVRFNTRWYDHYVRDNLDQRFDIYLTLYRRVYQYDEEGKPVLDDAGNPTYTVEAVPGYQHYDWNPMSDEGADPLYNQYVEVSNLPKYDEHGGEIVYYATVNHSQADATVKNLNYADPWFTYDASENAPKNNGYLGSATWDSANESDPFKAGSPDYVDVSGIVPGSETSNALREDGTFNFRLEQTMSAEGGKVWANLPAGFEAADLPDITFYLQRRVEGGHYDDGGSWVVGGNDWGELGLTVGSTKGSYTVASYDSSGTPNYDVADGKTAVAWTSDLSLMRGNRYAFVMNTYGNNTSGQEGGVSLPVYDRYGRVYEYRIREIIDGLIQKEADGSDAPGGYDVSDAIASGKTPEDAAGKIYNVTYGSWRGFMVGNVYNASQKGNLTVKKLFSNLEPGDRVTNCTFALYRYYVKADGTKSVAQLVGTKTLDNSSARANEDGQLERTVDFTDLDIYTPAGTYWVYYVAEQSLDGYLTRVGTGDLDRGSSDLKYFWQGAGSLADGSSCSDDLDAPAAKDDNAASFYQPRGTIIASDHTPDVTFENTYTGDAEDLGSLTGTKSWYDQDNIAGTRPGHVDLQVTRRYADGQHDATNNGDVVLQSSDPDGPAYIEWNYNAGANAWTYTIKNLERIAPNGTYWTYEVREKNVDGNYNVGANGGTVDMANFNTGTEAPLQVGAIDNYLKTKVGFTKVWADDASDAWSQRPVAYFTLQARVSTDGDGWSDWADAGLTFNTYLGTNLEQAKHFSNFECPDGYVLPNDQNTVDRVSAGNWNSVSFDKVWRDLPVTATVGEGDAVQTRQIEYRVVESRLVYDKNGVQQVVDLPNPADDGTYSDVTGSYQPSQVESSSTKSDGEYVMSTITNRLVSSTKVRITKTWDDEMNAWATRPGTSAKGDAWTSTFVLQRRTAGGEWSWLTSFGAPVSNPFNEDGSLNGSLRTVTIGDGASNYPAIQKTAEFSSLPATAPDGAAYEYRAAELVQGSYEAKDPTSESGAEVLATSGTQSLVAVSSRALTLGGGSEQVFNNVLKTTSLTGTKTWNDWGTGLAASLDPETSGIKLNLQRSVDGGKTWRAAKRGDGTDTTPSWTKNVDGTWTYTFERLPLADQQGRTYTYRAVEQDGSVPGFFSDKSASSDGAGAAADGTIKNVATRFTFDKVGDGTTGSSAAANSLNGVDFSVRDANGREVATWSRAEDGTVSSTVGGVAQTGEAAGYITGLAAGTYTVAETTTPAGYVTASDVQLAIGADGSMSVRGAGVAVVSGNDQAVAPERGNAIVRVTNQVFRAHVELNKFYNHGNGQVPVPSMTFDLYRKVAAGAADTLVATGITTDDNGSWTSKDSRIAVETVDGASVLGSFYQALADGLPQGSYYLLETGSSPLTQVTSDARYEFTVGASDNAQTITVNAENAEFNASVHLAKADSETRETIDGARFELFYSPTGADAEAERSLGMFETGKSYVLNAVGTGVESSATAASGALSLSGLKKGSYKLVERANTGYALDAADAPTATWTVSDGAQGADLDLADNDAVTWVSANFANDALENAPLRGSLTMKKTDARGNGLKGATFSLQRKGYDGAWAEFRPVTSDEDGTITVTNLPWGTYRFVETMPAPGYVGKGAMTDEATIDRNNVAASINSPLDLGVIANNQTTFTIKKTSWDGIEALVGAKYTVTPASGSAFVDGASEKRLTTGADGVAQPDAASDALAGNVIAGNSYVVTETQAPAGFVTPDPASVTVSVGYDGSLAIEGDAPDAWSIEGLGLSSTLAVRDKAIDLRLQKIDENGDPIAGSEFTLSGVFASGQDTRTISPDATSASSVFPDDMLEGQTYTLHESQPPVGYACVDDLTFRVAHASDGSVRYEVVGDLPAGWSISDDGVTATATDKLIDFNISKTDLSGNPLKNARFEIKGLFVDEAGSVSEATYEGTTNESGLINSVDCIAEGTRVTVNGAEREADGVYEIRETDAPYGYELEGTSTKVKIARDGSMTLLDGAGSAWSLGGEDATPTLTLSDTPVRLGFSKLAAGSEESLDGALFTIEGVFATADGGLANGGASQRLEGQTVEDLSNLKFVAGKSYTLTETKAPAGYELIQGSVSFTVGMDGTIQNFTTNHVSNGSFNFSRDRLTLVARDIPIRLAITKRSEDGHDLFDGHFTVTPQAGSAFADGSTDALELVTDADGVAHLAGEVGDESLSAKLVAGNAYELRETISPAGYKLIEGSWSFKVNADGTITSGDSQVQNGTIELAASADSITVTDEVIPFDIVKYGERDEDGNAPLLADAVFEVTPLEGSAFANSDALVAAGILEDGSARITTGDDGRAGAELVDQLVVGNRYEIREVVAPAGYTLLPEALTVTVEPDGRLGCGAADRAEGFEVRGDGAIEVFEGSVVDEATQFAVRKVDAEDVLLGLNGATFSLAPADGYTFADGSEDVREVSTETVSGEAGLAVFDRALLRADNESVYELRETRAPDGYALSDETLLFRVDTNGSVVPVRVGDDGYVDLTVDELADKGFALDVSGVLIVAADKPGDVTLRKVGEDGEALGGATFTLSCADGTNDEGKENHFANGSTTEVLELEPDAEGALLSRQLVVGNSYELEETAAPEGHAIVEGRVRIYVNADGTVQITGVVQGGDEGGYDALVDVSNDWSVSNDGRAIVLADPATHLRIAKRGSDGTDASAMAGARFEVSGLFAGAAESSSRVVTIGADGTAPELAGLLQVGERYVIREVAAPSGYLPLTSTFEVAVRQDGSIVSCGDVAGWSLAKADDGVWTVTATDDPVPPVSATPGVDEPDKTSKVVPQTGDETPAVAMSLIAAAGLALLALGLDRRRKRA